MAKFEQICLASKEEALAILDSLSSRCRATRLLINRPHPIEVAALIPLYDESGMEFNFFLFYCCCYRESNCVLLLEHLLLSQLWITLYCT